MVSKQTFSLTVMFVDRLIVKEMKKYLYFVYFVYGNVVSPLRCSWGCAHILAWFLLLFFVCFCSSFILGVGVLPMKSVCEPVMYLMRI